MSINKVFLSGNVGFDPKIVNLDDGKKIAKFSLATTDFNKDKTVQWHHIIFWGVQADLIEKYIRKGSHISIVGAIQYRDYVNKDGVKIYYTEITGSEIELPAKGNHDNSTEDNQGEWRKGEKRQVEATSDVSELGNTDDFDPNEMPPFQ